MRLGWGASEHGMLTLSSRPSSAGVGLETLAGLVRWEPFQGEEAYATELVSTIAAFLLPVCTDGNFLAYRIVSDIVSDIDINIIGAFLYCKTQHGKSTLHGGPNSQGQH